MLDYATLDGVAFHEGLSAAPLVWLEHIEGITGVPDIRGDVFDRPENDGVIEPTNQYLTARTLVLEGRVFGTTIADAWTNWTLKNKTILAAVRAQKLLKWRTQGGSIDLQANVRVSGPCMPVLDLDDQGFFYHFQLQLRQADPVSYSQTSQQQSTGAPSFSVTGFPFPAVWPVPWALTSTGAGSISATNAGNAPTWPLITIQGPAIGPVIQNQAQGKSIYFDTLNLGASDILIVDTNPQTRSALVAGVSKLGSLRYSDSDFFTISASATESIAFYALGGGTTGATLMTVSWRDGYIT